jgi:hypothetical protein
LRDLNFGQVFKPASWKHYELENIYLNCEAIFEKLKWVHTHIHTVDEMPAQEPAIGDTGRNASLHGVPSFGLRVLSQNHMQRAAKNILRHNLPSEAPLLFKRKENKQRYNLQSETQ